MPGVRKRGEEIRDFILANITENRNIAALAAERFGISLPAVYKHIDRLVSEKQVIKKSGRFIVHSKQYRYVYRNGGSLSEDTVWEKDIKKHFTNVPQNILNIWIYGFLEIFNNAIEHSKGKKIHVVIGENRIFTAMSIADDGVGIFNNIKTKFKLADEKDALLELAKGKQTTDTKRHSGQGIFFTSKAFDDFIIISNGTTFDPNPQKNSKPITGRQKYSTYVYMCLANNSTKKIKDVFDKFSTEVLGSFDKTIVPVYMANSSDLVSRSQARRILSGLELFNEVILDFRDIEYIGQAFADEIFRVFKNMYPGIVITAQNANAEVQYMINRAINTKLKKV
jgi:anti-sigma regulatory factor (Ser/Thr protein kinase)